MILAFFLVSAVPSYDIRAYCEKVSDSVGGSAEIELSCRQQEETAKSAAEARDLPERVQQYCDEVAQSIGGSYVIYNGCADQELEALEKLD